MKNYFRAAPDKPYHLSIAAVIFDENFEKVLCHHLDKVGHIEDIYVLMRESMEPNENFEDALHLGAREEFGATIEIIDYIGSSVAVDDWFGEINKTTKVEKTTLYFISKLLTQEDSKRVDDGTAESKSTLLWLSPDDLIEKMNNQFQKYNINNINESEMLKRAKEYINIHIST